MKETFRKNNHVFFADDPKAKCIVCEEKMEDAEISLCYPLLKHGVKELCPVCGADPVIYGQHAADCEFADAVMFHTHTMGFVSLRKNWGMSRPVQELEGA